MRLRMLLAMSLVIATSACASGATAAKTGPHPSATRSAFHEPQQVLRFGQTGQASDTSGNAWRISVSRPLLVASWHRNPDQGRRIVVYRVTVVNTSGSEDISGTDFEERVTGFTQNDLWSGGGTEADLRRFMSSHGFRPEPPEAGSAVASGSPQTQRSYYVAIRFSGDLSQVEFRPFGADDSNAAQLIWR
jgi:hypothetical protein